ncbi:nickel pincer cofactor biosynthesis protein LarC [Tepidibacter aestuarii]|uniref:LarC family nickel insertion protein n=1 Tax=Tepidibacter aestuarii TaxID=2925782 RepID=UPI0038CDC207|nr:putative Pyridinium-3,5-bisthiocarboxylic acid mononucleotide nickel chelatase [Tepidibacter aestuarii]
MEKILYFDCICGVSGDMTLGALLDLGLNKDKFLTEINKLNMNDEFEIVIKNKQENGINGTNVCVNVKEHTHEHHHDGHNHHHHRHLNDIHKIIDEADITDNAKEIAKDIFMQVATAEAKVHNSTIDKVHFHEVGATDSIVDIVGSAILIDMLNVDKIYCSSVPLGSGFVKCDHGVIPVPAPATVEILKKAKVKINSVKGETTTPTGAAIVKTLSDEFSDDIEFEIDSIGYGMGHKKFEIPNMLRVILGEKKKRA